MDFDKFSLFKLLYPNTDSHIQYIISILEDGCLYRVEKKSVRIFVKSNGPNGRD
jgi:hypothetical protein